MTRENIVINKTLQELRSSGYEMAKGEPDIRGWKVINSANQEIGKVKELLFDIQSRKIRYLIVDLNGKPINLLSRDIIIPVGLAELDEREKIVLFPDVTVGHFASLPDYKKDTITFQTERQIRDVFMPGDAAASDKLADIESQENPEREAFYNNEYFDENRMYRRRENEKLIAKKVKDANAYDDDIKRIPATDDITTSSNTNQKEGDIIYIPDEKDPTLFRRARIVREDDINS